MHESCSGSCGSLSRGMKGMVSRVIVDELFRVLYCPVVVMASGVAASSA